MLLREIVAYHEKIRETHKKITKINILSDLIRKIPDHELTIGLGLISGRLPFRKIGIGWATLREVLSTHKNTKIGSIPLADLNRLIARLSVLSGKGSQLERREVLGAIFRNLGDNEVRFLCSALLGEVRQGAGEKLILSAIGKAYGVPESELKRAYLFGMEISEIVLAIRKHRFKPTPKIFRPIRPMLAYPSDTVSHALEELGINTRWEYKLDGARFQAHKMGNRVRVFSRHLRDITDYVPELVKIMRGLEPNKIIVEGELIGFDQEGKPLPFQYCMRRFGRKKDIAKAVIEQPLVPYFFDLLYADEPLLDHTLTERLNHLKGIVPMESRIPAIEKVTKDSVEIFLRNAMEWGAEGLMAKKLDSPYVAGERVGLWLKLKPYLLVDCVIVAAEWGHGRRKGWLSNFHLAVWDETHQVLLPVGKTFKGLTDVQFRWITKELLSLKTGEFEGGILVRPNLVVEVAFSEVQVSPHYSSGFALRFARIKRVRTDKLPEEANDIYYLRRLHQTQRG